MPTDRFLLLLALTWATFVVYPGASEPFKVAGVALVSALLVMRGRAQLAPLPRSALLCTALAALLAAACALEPAAAIVGSLARAQGLLIALALLVVAWAASGLQGSDRQWLYRLAAILGGVLAAYALLQRTGFDAIHWSHPVQGRPAATLSNATSLAGWLVLLLPMTFMVAQASASRRALWLALAVLQLAGLVVTGSRSALLALLAVSALIGLLRSGRLRRHALPALWLGLLLTTALAAWRPDSLQDRAYLWRTATRALTSSQPLIDLHGRADARSALRPLLGFGPDQQQPALAAAGSKIAGRAGANGWEADRAHQWLLDRALEMGLIGVLGGVLLLWAVIQSLQRGVRAPAPADSREALFLAVALAAWGLHLQAGFALTGDRTLAWLWIGLALALGRRGEHLAQAERPASRGLAALRITLAGVLLTGALAASGLWPARPLQRLAPALAAEQQFVEGQRHYALALAAEPGYAADEMLASAQSFERAVELRHFDRDAALAAASAWVEAAANGAGPVALQNAQRWLDRLQASGTDAQRLAPLRARLKAVGLAIGE